MKQLKTHRNYLTQKIRDNKALMRYSSKSKAKELLKEIESLQIQLDELKTMKRF